MDYDTASQYLMCIEPLTAEESLRGLQVSVFPKLKREGQRKIEKELRKQAKRNFERQKKPKNTEDLYYHMLRTLGNGR